jgi:HNH endonuclease
MCIYCGTTKYRKIYESHYGKIPREENGRSYEIHHLDGNHDNNHPTNLSAVSLDEHYKIHYEQGDWAACLIMRAQRLDKNPEENRELASKHAIKKIQEGTHHFQDKENIKRYRQIIKDNRTNPFLGGEIQRKSNKDRIKNGTHNFLGPALNNDRILAGTHNFTGSTMNKVMLENGTHPSQLQWTCPHCDKSGKGKSNYKNYHGDNCKKKL